MPIQILPTEILLLIFFILVDEEISAQEFAISDFGSKFCQYYSFTRVCQRWRNISLQAPGLWRDVMCLNEQIVSAMLHRSQRMPVKIYYVDSHRDDHTLESSRGRAARLALREVGRIEVIVMQGRMHNISQLINAIEGPVPLLTCLLLKLPSGQAYELPGSFLAQNPPPQLLNLTLYNVSAPISHPAFRSRNLTVLILNDFEINIPIPVDAFLRLLHANPGLHTLQVTFAADSSQSVAFSQMVTLPKLEKLFLRAVPQFVDTVVSHLHIPRAAVLNIAHMYHWFGPMAVPTTPPFKYLPHFIGLLDEEYSIHILSVYHIRQAAILRGYNARGWDPLVEISAFTVPSNIVTAASHVPCLCAALTPLLKPVRKIIISGSDPESLDDDVGYTPEHWTAILHECDELVEMQIDDWYTDTLETAFEQEMRSLRLLTVVERAEGSEARVHVERFVESRIAMGRPVEVRYLPPTSADVVRVGSKGVDV